MIINKKNGFIENAVVVAYPSSDVSAVKTVSDAGTASFARSVKGAILIDGDSSTGWPEERASGNYGLTQLK